MYICIYAHYTIYDQDWSWLIVINQIIQIEHFEVKCVRIRKTKTKIIFYICLHIYSHIIKKSFLFVNTMGGVHTDTIIYLTFFHVCGASRGGSQSSLWSDAGLQCVLHLECQDSGSAKRNK